MAKPPNSLTRRRFIKTTSATLLGTTAALPAFGEPKGDAEKLALEGGPKALSAHAPKLVRWGEPEKTRLDAMIGQDSLFFWKGPQTTALIQKFQKICPLKHVMTCSSGTAAIHIAVAAAGIGPGDEVITTPITDIGSVTGVIFQQGVPVFADLMPGTYNLDPRSVEKCITAKTKAIIAVHLAGNPCDLKSLKALAEKHKLILIEDCAQGWGSHYGEQHVGTVGDVACFSFQNTKQITCGDGGLVASNNDRIGPLLTRFGDKGSDRTKPGLFDIFATNYRMSEPQAAVAAAQLDRLETIAEKRSKLARLLSELLKNVPGVAPHEVRADDRCTHYFYMIRLQPKKFRVSRAQFVKVLGAEGVGASAGYIPVTLFKNPIFLQHSFFAGRWPIKEMGLTAMDYNQVNCPEAEAILQTGVRLILNEAMSEDYVRGIANAVRKVATAYRA
jgi:dTDP-4-amino-4,6-dideoxygalactose transaminase